MISILYIGICIYFKFHFRNIIVIRDRFTLAFIIWEPKGKSEKSHVWFKDSACRSNFGKSTRNYDDE